MKPLIPRQAVSDLTIETLSGSWSLHDQNPTHFTLLVFYRGYHCPICKSYIQELNRVLKEFEQKGIRVIAISSDSKERAHLAQTEWAIDQLKIGHSLTKEQAQDWGLFRSTGRGLTSIGVEEPENFSEPGLFLIQPDKTLYWSQVSTMPFARPHFKEILGAIDFVLKNNYPARGELI